MSSLYWIRARLIPSILGMVSFIFEFNYLCVVMGWPLKIALVTGNLGLLVIVMALSMITRSLGKREERKLLIEWGGFPTHRFVKLTNHEYNNYKKLQLRDILEKRYSALHMPTLEDENNFPDKSDEAYEAIISCIIEELRDSKKYSIVFEENCNYGFYRNLRGLRPYLTTASILALCINCIMYCNIAMEKLHVCLIISSIVFIAINILIWILTPKSKVKEISEHYAIKLFDAFIAKNLE